jgi:hypothetical protein
MARRGAESAEVKSLNKDILLKSAPRVLRTTPVKLKKEDMSVTKTYKIEVNNLSIY